MSCAVRKNIELSICIILTFWIYDLLKLKIKIFLMKIGASLHFNKLNSLRYEDMTNSLELFITEFHFTFHNGRQNILHMWPIYASVFPPPPPILYSLKTFLRTVWVFWACVGQKNVTYNILRAGEELIFCTLLGLAFTVDIYHFPALSE